MSAARRGGLRTSAFLFLLLALLIGTRPMSLGAQSEDSRAPIVLTIAYSASSEIDAEMESVISDVLRLELGRAGVETTSVFELTGAPLREALTGGADLSQAFELAVSSQIDFVLIGVFYREGKSYRLNCDVYDPVEENLAASASRNLKIGFTLDEIIAECVKELVTKLADRFENLPPRDIVIPAVQTETAAVVQAPQPERSEIEDQEPDAVYRRFQLSVGFAPFLVVGRASDFFKSGLSPSFHGHYWAKLPVGRLGLGLYAALILFAPEDIDVKSQSYFLPIGADLRFEIGESNPLSVYVRLSGGPSLLSLNLDGSESQTKMVFFALGGIGVNIGITEMFGITLDSSYTMIFEGEEPIMGFSPGLYVDLRL